MRVGIRLKITVLIVVLLMGVFAVISVYQVRTNTARLRKDLLTQSKTFATLATEPIGNAFNIYKDSGTIRIKQAVDDFMQLNDTITNIAVADISGKILYTQTANGINGIDVAYASSFEPVYMNDNSGTLQRIIQPLKEATGAHRYSIIYDVSNAKIETAVRQEVVSTIIFGVVASFTAAVAMFILLNYSVIIPIRRLSSQAGKISDGNLDADITVKGKDELADVAASVKKMAESLKLDIVKLKEVDRLKSEFMTIASHNLRTPITIIQGYTDVAESYDNVSELKGLMDKIAAAGVELKAFADDMLMVSQIEAGHASTGREAVDIAKVVQQLSEEFTKDIQAKGLAFTVDIQDPAPKVVMANTTHIKTAIWNLLDNALKFTSQGSVTVNVIVSEYKVAVAVKDTGTGIATTELPKLFTKFHRGTGVLKYDYQGTGIGLYATHMVMQMYGGRIDVDSEEGKGSTFTVTLPLTDPRQTRVDNLPGTI